MLSKNKALAALLLGAAGLALAGPAGACENHAKAEQTHADQSLAYQVAQAPSEHAGHEGKQKGQHAATSKAVTIDKPWTRVTPPGAKVAGGFVTITNGGSESDRLVGGSFALSKSVEVHEMSMKDGVMRMQEVSGGLDIAPGATVELKPGSYHLMFIGLTGTPKEGEPVKGTLRFEKAGEVAVEFAVAPLGAKSPGGKMDGGQDKGEMDHGGHHMDHQK